MGKSSLEFETFDKAMRGLLSVPYQELQNKLKREKRAKERKKKRPTSTASARASSSGKRRVA
jgi:hypothetical protein